MRLLIYTKLIYVAFLFGKTILAFPRPAISKHSICSLSGVLSSSQRPRTHISCVQVSSGWNLRGTYPRVLFFFCFTHWPFKCSSRSAHLGTHYIPWAHARKCSPEISNQNFTITVQVRYNEARGAYIKKTKGGKDVQTPCDDCICIPVLKKLWTKTYCKIYKTILVLKKYCKMQKIAIISL